MNIFKNILMETLNCIKLNCIELYYIKEVY